MTSRPLFMRVEESTVILGPMLHVGWARASATVTWARSSAVRPRNGPPLAVSSSRSTRFLLSVARRHWWMAPCSLSTGTSSAPGVRRARCTTGPAAMSDSLLASARRRPASRVARVTDRPANPTTPLTTTSASVARLAMASGPPRTSHSGRASATTAAAASSATATTLGRCVRAWAMSTSGLRPVAPRAVSSKRSASASSTSSAWVPIEPVDPASATRTADMKRAYRSSPPETPRGDRSGGEAEDPRDVVRDREHEEHAVEPIEHATVLREDRAHVLQPEITLEQRLGQIAQRSDEGGEQPEHQRLAGAERTHVEEHGDDEDGDEGGQHAAHQSLDRLVGRDGAEGRAPHRA